jgi:hypothetical protein
MSNQSNRERLTPSGQTASAVKKPFQETPYGLGETGRSYNLVKALSLAGALEDEEISQKIKERK